MPLTVWKRLIDEIADHAVGSVLLRGGEPFLFPGIIELLDYIASRDIFICMDTNGTLLGRYAADLVGIENLHLTISIDGPEPIHDAVRGVNGCFQKIRDGLEALGALEHQAGRRISKSINFTITPESLPGMAEMPDVARSLGIETVCIVPYYYVTQRMGKEYDRLLKTHFNCNGFSWRGFHHEQSGVEVETFHRQHEQYLANLKGIQNYPYMDFSKQQYALWFSDPAAPVGSSACGNVETLLDIQPGGEANFCIDFPDFVIGNVMDATLEAIWNSPQAERFRAYRRQHPLPVCHRCGAKYMSQITT
jgi:radical SAM protein with 4Fe4S-binding SPASM domain